MFYGFTLWILSIKFIFNRMKCQRRLIGSRSWRQSWSFSRSQVRRGSKKRRTRLSAFWRLDSVRGCGYLCRNWSLGLNRNTKKRCNSWQTRYKFINLRIKKDLEVIERLFYTFYRLMKMYFFIFAQTIPFSFTYF